MKDQLYKILPNFMQNLMVTIFNFIAYRKRYGGEYRNFRKKFLKNRRLSLPELKKNQESEFEKLLTFAINNTNYYSSYPVVQLSKITNLPILSKEELRENINQFYSINKKEGIKSKTGGTTGKSLEVYYTPENMQERFAMLDDFRSRFGYELGKKTAWFSGKNLLTVRDLNSKIFWKTDNLYNVRYYSTFHIKDDYLKYYIENLLQYKPSYLVGFPSTILEIAKYGLKNNYDYPENSVIAVFPTAETITFEMRSIIEKFFKTKLYNQYASSEGAPFIIECENGNLHMELQSGIFEVLDENNIPSNEGRLVITSFTTYGTPLIRYDIGDLISLELHKKCNCGNANPLVKEILGRIDDYVYSPENGKINLGNVSNTLKDTKGIIRFQAIQDQIDKIELLLVVDNAIYNKEIEKIFLRNWRDRIGDNMSISLKYVNSISVEKSGKYRIVKNNIKHLLN